MIEATQKKLRETQFFLWLLLLDDQEVVRTECPGGFDAAGGG
jgi:hypothetical protein